MFELQFCQLHQVLPESSHSSRLEVYKLCVKRTMCCEDIATQWRTDRPELSRSRPTLFGRLRDLLELVAAELLAGLCLQDVSVLGPSFIQSLVSVLIVHQSPAPPVQQVLRRVTSTNFNMVLQQLSEHDKQNEQ